MVCLRHGGAPDALLPFTKTIEATDLRVECFRGAFPAKIAATALDDARQLYLGDTEGPSPTSSRWRVVPLGKPVALRASTPFSCPMAASMAPPAAARMAHLFVSAAAGALRDLGVLCATTEAMCAMYEYGGLSEARIVLGEADHLGCLFNYFRPPHRQNPIE